jgi:nucleoside-diphosphate-sugar epimerase
MTCVLVTGVNGFIGSAVARHLLTLKNEVLGIDLRDEPAAFPKGTPGYRFIKADITDRRTLPEELKKAEAVVHCAALVHQASRNASRADFIRVNCEGVTNILNSLSSERLRHIIFLSTVCIYGALSQGTIPDETTKPEPEDFYGESKVIAEKIVVEFSARTGVPYTILRLTPVYGPDFVMNIRKRVILPGGIAFYRLSSKDPVLSICSVMNVTHLIGQMLAHRDFFQESYIVKDEKDYPIREIISVFRDVWPQKRKPTVLIPSVFSISAVRLLKISSPRRGRLLGYKINKIMEDAVYSGNKLKRQGVSMPWNLKNTLKKL